MRISEIEIKNNTKLVDILKSNNAKEANEAYRLYNSIKELTQDFATPVYRLYNPITIIDILEQIEWLYEVLSTEFTNTEQILIALNELLDYFNS